MELVGIAGGIVLGTLAALPGMFLLHSRDVARLTVGRGLLAMLFAFVLILVTVGALAAVHKEMVPATGITAVLTFLALTTTAVLRSLRRIP